MLSLKNNKVILFNPRSAKWKHRIPNSILQVGASIYGKYDFDFIDGNMEVDPWLKIVTLLKTGNYKYVGFTVMPGPQLKEAIPFSRKIKEQFPDIIVVWGGYFATIQHKVVLESKYVDFVVSGPGDTVFPELLEALDNNEPYNKIKNLIY